MTAHYTVLNAGSGGDAVTDEDTGTTVASSNPLKIPVVKIHTGALGTDGGPMLVTNPLFVQLVGSDSRASMLGQKKTYHANTGPITGATATGVKSLAYIFHLSSDTTRAQLVRAYINVSGGRGGTMRLELCRLTAQNGTPGGTTITPLANDSASAASSAVVRSLPTGAPTRTSVYDGGNVPTTLIGNVEFPSSNVSRSIDAQPYVMNVSTGEGWEISQNVITTITTAPTFNITFEWTEQ